MIACRCQRLCLRGHLRRWRWCRLYCWRWCCGIWQWRVTGKRILQTLAGACRAAAAAAVATVAASCCCKCSSRRCKRCCCCCCCRRCCCCRCSRGGCNYAGLGHLIQTTCHGAEGNRGRWRWAIVGRHRSLRRIHGRQAAQTLQQSSCLAAAAATVAAASSITDPTTVANNGCRFGGSQIR